MASFLDRLGRFSYARRRPVAAAWIALVVVLVAGAASFSQPTSSSLSVPGTESQMALDVLAQKFPALSASGASARVVIEVPAGQTLTSASNHAAVEQLVAELETAPEVASVVDPYDVGAISPDGTIGFINLTYAVAQSDVTDTARSALLAIADEGRQSGLTVEVGGTALMAAPSQQATEGIGVVVAALVLVLTFGSLIAAGLPLLTAFVGIGVGVSVIAIASGFTELASSASTLALMLGLAVAIDYSLFIVSRYRHELATGRTGPDAAGRAVATAGSAVLFAGATVVIALAALAVVGLPILTQTGLAAAFTVGVSVLIALTLLPALLGFAGHRLRPAQDKDPEGNGLETGFGSRWARLITRRPVPVLLVAVTGLVLLATPALDLRLGLPDDSTAAPSSTQHRAYDLISEGFGPGVNGPLLVVVDGATSSDPQTAATAATTSIAGFDDVAAVTPPMFDATGETAIFQVIPKSGPSTQETVDLVGAIRDANIDLQSSNRATMAVTGQTALNIDVSTRMREALLPYLLVVVGLAIGLLTLVFRSILIPIKATLGFILSVLATFGAVVAVFQWGWLGDLFGIQQTGPVISLLPILLVGVVFGLAMDYEVFLVSRMREEYVNGATPRAAIVTGFGHGARVVMAAAIIMVSVFAGFILSDESFVKAIGFALAVAVLLDAFVVRMTIVPAVMAIAGDRAWWLPRWLARVLPVFDLEASPEPHASPAPRRALDRVPGNAMSIAAPMRDDGI